MRWLTSKKILVTGSCGTVGSEIVKVLSQGHFGDPAGIIGIDNNETSLFFQSDLYKKNDNVHFFLGDIRDSSRINELMSGIDIVFHVAALKHVELCEQAPFDAVQSNIFGVRNIIEAAHRNNVEKVIFTSSDKAVNPTNVMGTSKLMGERLFSAANIQVQGSRTIFASTRFGNVLGSNGSVLPLFRHQIRSGGPVTLTDKRMSRFVMSCREAAELVIESARVAVGGEVFITKMPVMAISDLASAMISSLSSNDIPVVEVGVKPGEKLYEELMTDEESVRAFEMDDFFVILPAFRDVYNKFSYAYLDSNSFSVERSYISSNEKAMSIEDIKSYLVENDLMYS